MEATSDPEIFILKKSLGYVQYLSINTGRRWEVVGTCDYRGDCLIGAVLPDGTYIDSRETLDALSQERGRLVSEMDVPVGPGFTGCCPLEVRWL